MGNRSLADKVVVITGASSGIGRATALALGAEGTVLHLIARRGERLQEVCREAEAQGAIAAHAHCFDIRDEAALAHLAGELNAQSPVDILINNAGVGPLRGFLDTTIDDWTWTFDTNVHAAVRTVRAFLPSMLERGRGTIVNVASLAGLVANNLASYSASKFALVGLSESLAIEFGPRGVDVIVVCPGVIKTEMVQATVATGRADDTIAQVVGKMFERVGADPSVVAHDIVRAIHRPQFLVVSPWYMSVLYRAHQTAPSLIRKVMGAMS